MATTNDYNNIAVPYTTH